MRWPRFPRFPRFGRTKRTPRTRRADHVIRRGRGFRQRVEKKPSTPTPKPKIKDRVKKTLAVNGAKKGKFAHWENLWNSMVINSPEWHRRAEQAAMKLRRAQGRYMMAGALTGVPWEIVAVIHHMEGSGSFKTHLHNGDGLSGRTTNIPAGRPKHAPHGQNGAYTWEESAIDALRYDELDKVEDRSIGSWLYELEAYNGTGYLRYHKDVNTPYLWSGSKHYTAGKYVSDGRWDQDAVSKQVGAALILKKLGFEGERKD